MALVCWSGGCDSTLLLCQLLEAGKEPVRTLSFSHPQVQGSAPSLAARKVIRAKLRGRAKAWKAHVELSVRQGRPGGIGHDCGSMLLPALWLALAVPHLRVDEDLYFGYVRGDDFWHYRTHYGYAYDHLTYATGLTGKLQYPLEWTDKEEVLRELRKRRLLKACWSCELPDRGRACKRCTPCLTRQAALWKMRLRDAGKIKPRYPESEVIEIIGGEDEPPPSG